MAAILRRDGCPVPLAAVLVTLRQLEALELPASVPPVEMTEPEASNTIAWLPGGCVPFGFH